MSDGCAFDLCDGDGLLYDADTNTAYPCRCRRQLIARRRASNLSAVIPRRYRDVVVRPAAGDRHRAGDRLRHPPLCGHDR